jgi:processive 1,2-diacylglycerol beta-glucosyltransferase
MGYTPNILLTYVLTGAGHYAPAKAVAGYLHSAHPENSTVRTCDFFKEIGKHDIDSYLISTCDSMVIHPRFNHYGHALLRALPFTVKLWMHEKFKSAVEPAAEFIRREQPDIVLSSHGFTAHVLEQVRKQHGLDFSLISLNTDPFSSHIFLELLRGQDAVIVSSPQAKNLLTESGYPEEKITQLPFPISTRFNYQLKPSPKLFSELGFDHGKKTLLISFGGGGIGNIRRFIDALIDDGAALNLIMITGNNHRLRQELTENYPPGKTGNLTPAVLGFVDNMAELAAVSDFCFIKPGASTTYEHMIMRKPIIFYQATSHIESANVDFAVSSGVGFSVKNSPRAFVQAVKQCMDERTVSEIRRRYESMQLENGTAAVAEYVYGFRR